MVLPELAGGTFPVEDLPLTFVQLTSKTCPEKFFSPYVVRVFYMFLLALCCRKKVLTYIPI